MVEKILEKVANEMVPYLEERQLEHLKNALYINFHGKEVCNQCTDLVPRGGAGMKIEEAKEFLGHEKLDTTMICCTIKEKNLRKEYP